MSFLDDAISTIGQGLAQTAVTDASKETGMNVGGMINTLFGNQQASGGSDMANLLASLQGQFSGSEDQLLLLQSSIINDTELLQDMGDQLQAISNTLGQISGEIAGIDVLLAKLERQELFNTWNAVDIEVNAYRAATIAAYGDYGSYMAKAKTTKAREIEGLVTSILATESFGPSDAVQFIHDEIVPSGQGQSVLKLWSDMVIPLVTGGLIDFREAVDQYIQYYQRLAYVQLQATNLLMEAHIYYGDSTQANTAWTNYREALLDQENSFISALLPLISAGGTMMSWPGVAPRFGYSANYAAMQINPEIQLLTAGPSYFQPSAMLRRAEEVLAQLFVTKPDDRRIVIHMIYSAEDPIKSLLAPIKISLQSSGGATIAPSSTASLGTFSYGDYSGLDPNLVFGGDVTRMVYGGANSSSQGSNFTDGSYTIQNMNNQLPPQSTYAASENVNFMGDGILAAKLYIDGIAKFDFTNFVAYSAPDYCADPTAARN